MTDDAVWISRNPTTTRHLRGALEAAEAASLTSHSSIRVILIAEGEGARLPDGRVADFDSLPVEGLFIVPE